MQTRPARRQTRSVYAPRFASRGTRGRLALSVPSEVQGYFGSGFAPAH